MIKKIIIGTILSVLIFFSISFVTVLFQISSPIHRQTNGHLDIGFPFIYYSQFMVDGPEPNSGWDGNNLILDILLIWIVATGVYVFLNRETKK